MSQRIFGPIRGAGVQIEERDGQKPIEAAALGWVGYGGILEKGDPHTLMIILSKKQLLRRCGDVIPQSLLPDATQDYFDLAGGAGGIALIRVTDGNEVAATRNLYSRRTSQTLFGTVSAKNGGRWGGVFRKTTAIFIGGGSLTANTLTTGTTMHTNQWAGGWLELDGVPGKRYPIVGNTAAGVVTVASDQTMSADLAAGASPTDFRYYLVLDHTDTKTLKVEIRDGELNPDTEFGMFIYVDGNLVNKYPNLSIQLADPNYWVNVINSDTGNFEITVADSFTGSRTADVRPANAWRLSSGAILATVFPYTNFDYVVNSPSGGNPTVVMGAVTAAHEPQTLTMTMTSATAYTLASDRFGAVPGVGTLGVPFAPTVPGSKWLPPFTPTAGATPLVATDTVVIHFKPLRANELAGGYIYPDKVGSKRSKFRIVSNDFSTITVADGADMTAVATNPAQAMIQAPLRLEGGLNGNDDIVDVSYTSQLWDVDASPFNRLNNKGYGLVKLATPGITSVAVQKAGLAYAAAKNHQYRYEIPANIVDESSADQYVNEQLGRSDYAVVSFPTYVIVPDPTPVLGAIGPANQGRLKTISSTGMVHGREARIAADFLGYHKAEAGETAILPRILDLPTSDAVLNEEFLNPKGIGVIKKIKGNFVIWGDRTLWLDPQWTFKHQRELMSYYEHVLQESFGFIIFGLNDGTSRAIVKTSMVSFFLPEWRKGALNTDLAFTDACSIKIDAENNTTATKAVGDEFCDLGLALADTVERLRIRISKQGIFELAS